MKKVLIKYSLIFTAIIFIAQLLTIIPVVNIYFDSGVFNVIRFAATGGIMLYAINDFLKNHNAKGLYNKGIGFTISFAVVLFGYLAYYVLIILLNLLMGRGLDNLSYLVSMFLNHIMIAFIFALIIPFTFRNKAKPIHEDLKDEILDADLDD